MKEFELELLIFCSGDSCFGIDIEQIAHMAEAASESGVLTFRQLFGEPPATACGTTMKQIAVKGRESLSVLIPEPEEVIRLSLCDLRSLPAIFQAAQPFGIWAVALWNGRMIAVVDLYKNEVLNSVEKEAHLL